MFLIYSLSRGGAERVTATLANAMAARGHDVVIVLQDAAIPPAYDLDMRVTVAPLHASAPTASPARPAPLRMMRDIAALRAVLRHERPDLAIGMMNTAAILLGLARIGLRGCFVGAERVYPPAVPLPRAWALLRPWAYGLLDAVAVQTRKAAEWVRHWTRAREVCVIGNPVARLTLGEAEPAPANMLPTDAKLVLAAGRLVSQKRLDHAITAFAQALGTASDWHLAIIGDGPLRADLIAMGQALAPGRVHLVGNVGQPGDWFERAEVFLLTSQFEGMPNALMEAMAHGTAPIAYDIDTGPADLIDNGTSGWLVPAGDLAVLTARLAELAGAAPMRRGMQTQAAAIVDRFAVDAIVDQWLALARPHGA